jgi:hypothetical protein
MSRWQCTIVMAIMVLAFAGCGREHSVETQPIAPEPPPPEMPAPLEAPAAGPVSETQGSTHIQADSKETKPDGTIVYLGNVTITKADGDVIQAAVATIDKDGRMTLTEGKVNISSKQAD